MVRTKLNAPPELPAAFPVAHLSELVTWYELGWSYAADGRLYAALEGDGSPASPWIVRLYPVAHDPGEGVVLHLTLEDLYAALEEILPGGVAWQLAFPPQISGPPGSFAANMEQLGEAGAFLEVRQAGALANTPAATRWELGGGMALGRQGGAPAGSGGPVGPKVLA